MQVKSETEKDIEKRCENLKEQNEALISGLDLANETISNLYGLLREYRQQKEKFLKGGFVQSAKSLKRKVDKNQKHNTTPMKSIRLPVPLVNKLLDLKKKKEKGLSFFIAQI